MAEKDKEGWPLYALADYEGAGSLLDMCHSVLLHPDRPSLLQPDLLWLDCSEIEAKATDKPLSTSDYHTQESSCVSDRKAKAKVKKSEVGACGLKWWHLVELVGESDTDSLEAQYKARILRLCSGLAKSVG